MTEPILYIDLPKAKELLSLAFVNDPFIRWLVSYQNEGEFMHKFPTLLQTSLEVALPMQNSYFNEAKNGISIWVPPHRVNYNLKETLIFVKNLWSISSFKNFTGMISVVAGLDKYHPKEPHYYLYYLGVHPDFQGKGVGSQLIGQKLELIDQEGKAAYLETANEKNLALYNRFGFKVTASQKLKNGPELFFLTRKAK